MPATRTTVQLLSGALKGMSTRQVRANVEPGDTAHGAAADLPGRPQIAVEVLELDEDRDVVVGEDAHGSRHTIELEDLVLVQLEHEERVPEKTPPGPDDQARRGEAP